jgi:hypothetical protein
MFAKFLAGRSRWLLGNKQVEVGEDVGRLRWARLRPAQWITSIQRWWWLSVSSSHPHHHRSSVPVSIFLHCHKPRNFPLEPSPRNYQIEQIRVHGSRHEAARKQQRNASSLPSECAGVRGPIWCV